MYNRILPYQDIYAQGTVMSTVHDSFYLKERSYEINESYLQAVERHIWFEGVVIVYRDWKLSSPVMLETRHKKTFLKLQFELEGKSHFINRQKEEPEEVVIRGGTYAFMFFPRLHGHLRYPQSRNVVDVVFDPEYLQGFLGDELSCLGDFGHAIRSEHPAIYGGKASVITNQMKEVLKSILHCPYSGLSRRLWVESKVRELLVFVLEQHEQTCFSPGWINLRPQDVERLYYIKSLIDRNPQEAYTLSMLAELAVMNDFKLKKGFKQLFGYTVFGYIHDVRMERSRDLILREHSNIYEVAMQMGYKYPQHFTKAFKKKFGYLPSDIK